MNPESNREIDKEPVREADGQKVSLKNGYWFYFEDEGTRIVVFASALTGKEVVFVDDEIVSSMRSFRLKATHRFVHNGRNYEVIIALENIFKGTINSSLLRDGVLIHKTSKSFYKSFKSFFITSFIFGLFFGLIFGFGLVWITNR